MESQEVYIKPDVIIEPLFDSWYAWLHLVSPATAARNVANRHLPIMKSYLKASAAHIAASKNPEMRGGPFIDYPVERTKEVAALVESTSTDLKDLVEFSDAIDAMNKLISAHPKGASLKELYLQVPECLQGFIELVYDVHNNLSYRFIEPLLYQSKFYKKRSQSIVIWKADSHKRSFVLSTPRLAKLETDKIHLQIPFDSPAIDMIGEMKFKPRPAKDIFDLLDLNVEQKELFSTFFTTSIENRYVPVKEGELRVRYFGHACVLVETSKVSILIDAVVAYQKYEDSEALYTYADLPPVIDYVFLTHNHQDHVLLETLLPLRHKIKNIVVPRALGGALQDPCMKQAFKSIGFDSVQIIEEMESITAGDCQVTGIPFFGEHSDLNILAKLCFHIRAGSRSLMFAVDSAVLESKVYQYVNEVIGGVDTLFLGMECEGAPLSWLYGPLLDEKLPRDIDKSRRLSGSNFEQGIQLVDIFSPQEVYVYAMGQESYVEFISSIKYTETSPPIVESNKLISECQARGLVAERLYGAKELTYAI